MPPRAVQCSPPTRHDGVKFVGNVLLCRGNSVVRNGEERRCPPSPPAWRTALAARREFFRGSHCWFLNSALHSALSFLLFPMRCRMLPIRCDVAANPANGIAASPRVSTLCACRMRHAFYTPLCTAVGRVVELADTQDLGSCAARLRGSNPLSPIQSATVRHET